MKFILPLILMLFSINCFSQTPNPNLFQTWYLNYDFSSDNYIYHFVSDISPSISPYITFSETYTYNGQGACNSFNGNFSSSFDDTLSFSNFSGTLNVCGYPAHNSFEAGYFTFIQQGGQYFITGSGNNMELIISNPIFVNYVFKNSQLHSPNFDLEQIIIYPNPVDSKLFIDFQNNRINRIEIFNSLGQTVKTVNTNFNIIDTSDFASGVYLMKLYSEGETVCRKIMKK